MPRAAVSHKQLSSDLARCLEDNEFEEFKIHLGAAEEINYDLDELYGKEVGYKTILQLAIEEDDHDTIPFIEALITEGASARFINSKLKVAPIHVAAEEIKLSAIELLLKYPQNKADVNVENRLGLTALHILLAKLLDFAFFQSKPKDIRPNKMDDEMLDKEMLECIECMKLICMQKELQIDFDSAVPIDLAKLGKNNHSYKKLGTMTPLQIVCSFQSWNAKPVNLKLHKKLAEIVEVILMRGADPNAVTAKGAVAGSVAGSTPPVLLAATRGYHLVINVFKDCPETNFLVENKFSQNIIHIVLKAGYYNKILVHGEESAGLNEQTIYCLFNDNNSFVKYAMKAIINRVDSYDNTALYYAKYYPNHEITKFLLKNGAKLHMNDQNMPNVSPKGLEEYFFEGCIEVHGDDVDDEDFSIKIYYDLFALPEVDPRLRMDRVDTKAQAWSNEVERVEKGLNMDNREFDKRKVDTKRLEIFSDVSAFRFLLKHPVLGSFLEMEINDLKSGYIFDFVFYLIFVIIVFLFLSERFVQNNRKTPTTSQVFYWEEMDYSINVSTILIMVAVTLLILREIYQLIKLKRRYFHYFENLLEWMILLLILFELIPDRLITPSGDQNPKNVQMHLAAFTYLLSFTQLYLLLVRMVPNTPIPLYISMYTTVLKTYTFILCSYFAFLLSFAFSFSLVYSQINGQSSQTNITTPTETVVCPSNSEPDIYGNVGLSLITTLIMFTGEFNYASIPVKHWLGQGLLALFIFLITIVLMNLLNGLAVSDIQLIRNEVDTYYHISIVETLAHNKWVKLLSNHVLIHPNIKPESQTLLGIEIPGQKKYPVLGNGKKKFYLSENVVKAAKELVVNRQAANDDNGEVVTLEVLDDSLDSIKREQMGIKTRLNTIEDNLALILDIMQSRTPAVERY